MAKTKDSKSIPVNSGKVRTSGKKVQSSSGFDDHPLIKKYFWIIIPVLTIVYFISSKYSVGFYQDDEVGQYINMIKFWSDPFAILGNSPKPGYKIFMVVPSLFGYEAVLFINAFIASLSVYFTYLLLKTYKINHAYFGALLLALQPLFFDLSFRSYAEIFTSLLILAVLILYRKELFFWSALICGYIFTVRQEIALLMIVFAIIYFRKKNFISIAALAVFPLIYNILGYFKTGDMLLYYLKCSLSAIIHISLRGYHITL